MDDPRHLGSGSIAYVSDLLAPELSDEDLHHLLRVRRIRDGETILIGDGVGGVRRAVVCLKKPPASKGLSLSLELDEAIFHESPRQPRIRVATCTPSTERLSYLIQKATEVGVDDLYLLSVQGDSRGGKALSDSGVARLSKIAREAASQSRRAYLPTIHPPISLGEFISRHRGEIALGSHGGTEALAPEKVLLIGPEAGLDPGIVDLPAVALGANILRTETAAIVGAALLVAMRERIVVSFRKTP